MNGASSLELLVDVVGTEPLRLHVSLHQPDAAGVMTWVPRILRPVGAFVRVVVRNDAGGAVFETNQPKFKPKLKPDSDDSYLCLDPGYSYGTLVEVDLGRIADGRYRLEVTYSNLGYQGTADRAVGALELAAAQPILLGA